MRMIRELDREPRSVAVVRLRTGGGDLLCGVPALRALRARLPEARISLVTFPEMAVVVERQAAYVDELLPFPGWPGIPERPPRPARISRFLAACRARRFDLAIQAYGARAAAGEVTARLGARRTAGFCAPGALRPPPGGGFLPYPEHLHEIDRQLALMQRLGAPARGRHLEFPMSGHDDDEAAALRTVAALDDYAVLHPGATAASRRWPAERFAAVGDALAADGLGVAVSGTPPERRLTADVVAAMRSPAVDLAGRTTLGGFAALLRDAALLVSSDTGAAHLAAAVGTPAVVCFLAGDPTRWAHAGHRVARIDVGCNPCPHLECPIDHRCAERLRPGRVADLARSALKGQAAP
jgi:ADP-heptose:LPS heptosyltransferase